MVRVSPEKISIIHGNLGFIINIELLSYTLTFLFLSLKGEESGKKEIAFHI
jgi:hypothetical protein